MCVPIYYFLISADLTGSLQRPVVIRPEAEPRDSRPSSTTRLRFQGSHSQNTTYASPARFPTHDPRPDPSGLRKSSLDVPLAQRQHDTPRLNRRSDLRLGGDRREMSLPAYQIQSQGQCYDTLFSPVLTFNNVANLRQSRPHNEIHPPLPTPQSQPQRRNYDGHSNAVDPTSVEMPYAVSKTDRYYHQDPVYEIQHRDSKQQKPRARQNPDISYGMDNTGQSHRYEPPTSESQPLYHANGRRCEPEPTPSSPLPDRITTPPASRQRPPSNPSVNNLFDDDNGDVFRAREVSPTADLFEPGPDHHQSDNDDLYLDQDALGPVVGDYYTDGAGDADDMPEKDLRKQVQREGEDVYMEDSTDNEEHEVSNVTHTRTFE